MAVRVALVDDRRLLRELLHAQLRGQPGIEVLDAVGRAQAHSMAASSRPDVLVVDQTGPNGYDAEYIRTLRARQPRIKLVVLSRTHAPEVRSLQKAGADAVVSSDASLAEVVEAIRSAALGRRYLSAGLEKDVERTNEHRARALLLSPRENQVLALIAEGLRSPQIARRLGISAGTVEVHRRNLKRKLGLRSIAALTRFAVEADLVPAWEIASAAPCHGETALKGNASTA